MENCIFCKFVNNEAEHSRIWEDEVSIAFLDLYPVNPGHVLLVPKAHIDYIFDLDGALYHRLWDNAKKLAGPLREIAGSKRVGIAVEGFGVPHVHIHLVPINRGNELDPNRAQKADPEDLKRFSAALLKKLSPA